MAMMRTILRFQRDEEQEWTAILDCGHKRHLRHDPPRESRPLLEDPQFREDSLGQKIDCGRCAQRLVPETAEVYKSTPVFTEETVPAGLLRDHSLKCGVWGRLVILSGELLFHEDNAEQRLAPKTDWIVLPEVVHHVTLLGQVSFKIEFLKCPNL